VISTKPSHDDENDDDVDDGDDDADGDYNVGQRRRSKKNLGKWRGRGIFKPGCRQKMQLPSKGKLSE